MKKNDDNTRPVRTRIAPAPTGPFHIGNARTALFNFLFAQKQGGVFVVRIEDTDQERSEKRYENEILDSMEWLGIRADEGPIAVAQNQKPKSLPRAQSRGKNQKYIGDYGPYRQSERRASYAPQLEKLIAGGNAFYCPHSEAELEAEKKSLMTSGKPPVHRCSHRDRGMGEKPSAETIIRFKTPDNRIIKFNDLIRGEIAFESGLLGDFSIAKDLQTPLYNFAVVIDDYEMKISHVIRGEDHISNTPKQMLIQEALGLPHPAYAHLPLILGPDRSKLSARHGATAIREFREQGYLPEALVNFMALLGWNPGGDNEIFSMPELIANFDLAKVQKSGAVFNLEKLDWMNGEYIRKKSPPALAKICMPFLKDFLKFSIPNDQFSNEYIEKVIALEQPRLKKLSEIGERTDYFFREPEYDKELLRWKQMTDDDIAESLKFSEKIIKSKIKNQKSKIEIERIFSEAIGDKDKGRMLWPLRVALSGRSASPGPFEIMVVLGKAESVKRVTQALEKFRKN